MLTLQSDFQSLEPDYKITDDIDISVTYQSKTYTQFLGCSGVDRSLMLEKS